MASRPDLLRDSKINALKQQLKQHQCHPNDQQQQQQDPPSPIPADVIRALAAAKKRKDSASALQNKECFNKLWALGREPDRLVASPRLHAMHISQSRPRRTRPDEVRKGSLLAVEVRPEDVVEAEIVDGWSLCSDDTDEDMAEDDEVEGDLKVEDMGKSLVGGSSALGHEALNGDDGAWDESLWVLDIDNSNLGYSPLANGYWVKW